MLAIELVYSLSDPKGMECVGDKILLETSDSDKYSNNNAAEKWLDPKGMENAGKGASQALSDLDYRENIKEEAASIGDKQVDSTISMSDDEDSYESDYESYDELEMYENIEDYRGTSSSSPEKSTSFVAKTEVKQEVNEDDDEENLTDNATDDLQDAPLTDVNEIRTKKFRKVNCSELTSRHNVSNLTENATYSLQKTRKYQNNEDFSFYSQNPKNIDTETEYATELSYSSSGCSDLDTETVKRPFWETDSDQSSFNDSKRLKNDNVRNEPTDEFKCHQCFEVFSDRFRLYKHSSVHNVNNLHKCDLCEEAFSLPIILRNHKLNRHSTESKFVCDICNKSYKRESYLNLHKNVHLRPNFKCDICGCEYSSIRMLNSHIHNKHSNDIKEIKEFSVLQSTDINKVDNLLQEQADTGKDTDSIDEVDSFKAQNQFSGQESMLAADCQIRTTSPDRPKTKVSCFKPKPKFEIAGRKCKFCDEIHANKKQLNEHLLGEHSDFIHSCAECNLIFTSPGNLKQHNKDRHSKESAVCPLCLKVFKCKRYMNEHIKFTHEKMRNFVCKICGAKFRRSNPLRIHEMKHKRNGETVPREVAQE